MTTQSAQNESPFETIWGWDPIEVGMRGTGVAVCLPSDHATDKAPRPPLPQPSARLPVDLEVMDRAMEVQHHLAKRGQHRLPLPDLIIAAKAEVHGATVLHHDHDYDLIGAVTDQPTQWIVPRGTGG